MKVRTRIYGQKKKIKLNSPRYNHIYSQQVETLQISQKLPATGEKERSNPGKAFFLTSHESKVAQVIVREISCSLDG